MKRKFVNKKTGAEARVMAIYLDSDGVMQVDGYDTVEDLMDNYAAYEEYNPPKEPLIKDEKVRKAVRAWAEACAVSKVMVAHPNVGTTTLASISNPYKISFSNERAFLPMGKEYTIAELCGEEDE